MPNRKTGLICVFYTDTPSELQDMEQRLRRGFATIGVRQGWKDETGNLQKVTDAELRGARIFKREFGKRKTVAEFSNLVLRLGLIDSTKDAPLLARYMAENDIPYFDRMLFDKIAMNHIPIVHSRWAEHMFSGWNRFTLGRDPKNGNFFVLNGYPLTISDLTVAYRASVELGI